MRHTQNIVPFRDSLSQGVALLKLKANRFPPHLQAFGSLCQNGRGLHGSAHKSAVFSACHWRSNVYGYIYNRSVRTARHPIWKDSLVATPKSTSCIRIEISAGIGVMIYSALSRRPETGNYDCAHSPEHYRLFWKFAGFRCDLRSMVQNAGNFDGVQKYYSTASRQLSLLLTQDIRVVKALFYREFSIRKVLNYLGVKYKKDG